jgi:hypothetical protein
VSRKFESCLVGPFLVLACGRKVGSCGGGGGTRGGGGGGRAITE